MRKIYSLLLLGAFMLLGAQNVWADVTYEQYPYIYFDPYVDASTTVNEGYIQLAGRKYNKSGDANWYTAVTTLTNISNTRLYYTHNLHGADWSNVGFNGWSFISNSSAWSDGANQFWGSGDGYTESAWYTAYNNTYSFNSNSVYLVCAPSATKNQTVTPSYQSSGIVALNNTQTIKYSVNSGSGFAELTEGTVPATIAMESYKFVSETYDAVSASSASATLTQGGSNYSATLTAARTANTTLTISNVASGYFFVGWYDAATGGNLLEKGDTYSYNPTTDGTVYARFEYGDYPLNISSALWSSLYLPQEVVVPANCKAYYVSDVTGTTATLVAINAGQVIPAATPVIVEATASGTYYFNYSASNADAPTPNLLHGVTATTPIESIDPGAGNTLYVLGVKESVVGFYVPSAQITTLAPYKAYLVAGTITGAPMIRFEENDATGIQNVEVSEKAVKFIENGKLFIQKDGVVYDMTGRVVR